MFHQVPDAPGEFGNDKNQVVRFTLKKVAADGVINAPVDGLIITALGNGVFTAVESCKLSFWIFNEPYQTVLVSVPRVLTMEIGSANA